VQVFLDLRLYIDFWFPKVSAERITSHKTVMIFTCMRIKSKSALLKYNIKGRSVYCMYTIFKYIILNYVSIN